MPQCCGKDRQTNFCPECGKAMDMRAGLRGLLRHVGGLMEKAAKRVAACVTLLETRESSRPDYQYDKYVAEAKKSLESAKAKYSQYKDWQESLIKAIDGE